MDRLDAYTLFVRIAELGSFRAAAAAHAITPGAASKRIAALEDTLGVTLLQRTTRAVTLSEDGQAFLDGLQPLLREFSALESTMSDASSALAGRLRLSAPLDWGRMVLGAPLNEFVRQWPEIEVHTALSDRMVDLVEEGYDMAIRIGQLQSSPLIARKIGQIEMKVCAAPAFLKIHGLPENPDALARMPCIIDTNKPQPFLWKFQKDEQQISVRINGRMQINGAGAACNFAATGGGLTCTPDFACEEFFRSGQLVRVLADWQAETRGIWALYPPSRHLSRRVRLFIDHLVHVLK